MVFRKSTIDRNIVSVPPKFSPTQVSFLISSVQLFYCLVKKSKSENIFKTKAKPKHSVQDRLNKYKMNLQKTKATETSNTVTTDEYEASYYNDSAYIIPDTKVFLSSLACVKGVISNG